MTKIQLGDELEDITTKMRGICIGKIDYLDGSVAYLVQPPCNDSGERVNAVEVQEAYIKHISEGVRVKRVKRVGFTSEL